jgi:hypothetical protein
VLSALAGVAVTAQHFQVVRLVNAPFGYGVNVVYLKSGTVLSGNAANLAAIVIALQYFKAEAGFDCLALSRHCPLNKRLTFVLRNFKSRSFTASFTPKIYANVIVVAFSWGAVVQVIKAAFWAIKIALIGIPILRSWNFHWLLVL